MRQVYQAAKKSSSSSCTRMRPTFAIVRLTTTSASSFTNLARSRGFNYTMIGYIAPNRRGEVSLLATASRVPLNALRCDGADDVTKVLAVAARRGDNGLMAFLLTFGGTRHPDRRASTSYNKWGDKQRFLRMTTSSWATSTRRWSVGLVRNWSSWHYATCTRTTTCAGRQHDQPGGGVSITASRRGPSPLRAVSRLRHRAATTALATPWTRGGSPSPMALSTTKGSRTTLRSTKTASTRRWRTRDTGTHYATATP